MQINPISNNYYQAKYRPMKSSFINNRTQIQAGYSNPTFEGKSKTFKLLFGGLSLIPCAMALYDIFDVKTFLAATGFFGMCTLMGDAIDEQNDAFHNN